MEKNLTNNLLLFSTLTIILCTTAKASEDKKQSSKTMFGMRINPMLEHQNKTQILRDQKASDDFKKTVAIFQQRYTRACQQETLKEENGTLSFRHNYQNHNLGHSPTQETRFLALLLGHFKSQNIFDMGNFDSE